MVVSGTPQSADNLPVTARLQLDNVLRCLRTFKEGYVGTGELYFKFVKFCPLLLGSYGFFNHFILPGIYQISNEEVEKLQNHAQHIFTLSESAMETACARLADAETRVRPQDRGVFPNSPAVFPEGSAILPEVPSAPPDGRTVFPNDRTVSTNGRAVSPDLPAVRPNGRAVPTRHPAAAGIPARIIFAISITHSHAKLMLPAA